MKAIIANFIFMLLFIQNLHGQGVPYNLTFKISPDNYYNNSALIALSDDKFVICYDSYDSGYFSIMGQIYTDFLIPKGEYFYIKITSDVTSYNLYQSAVAKLTNERFLVCWVNCYKLNYEYYFSIFGQLLDPSGVKIGNEFQISTKNDSRYFYPAVAPLSDGDFVVCWNKNNLELYGQIFDASGVKKGQEFMISSRIPEYPQWHSVASLSEGRFVICWSRYIPPGIDQYIFGQIFDKNGQTMSDVFQINSTTSDCQYYPQMTSFPNGGFVVCWISSDQDRYRGNIMGQLFDDSGYKRGTEFQVNSDFVMNFWIYDTGPTVATLPDNGFVVLWTTSDKDRYDRTIIGRLFDSNGNKKWHEFQVKKKYSFAEKPDVVSFGSNGFLVNYIMIENTRRKVFGKYFLNKPIVHQLQDYLLIEPIDDTTLNTTRPTLHWQQPSSISKCYNWELIYDIFIDTDYNFPHPQIIKNIEDTTYTIDSLAAGKTYFWKVLAKNLAGDSLWSTQQDWGFFIKPGATLVESVDNELPQNFELCKNYPNPFNSSTEIRYCLPNAKASYKVQLKIYDVLGRLVKVLVDQEQSAGSHAISWDGTDLGRNRVASGVYFYTLLAGELKMTRKMLLLQ